MAQRNTGDDHAAVVDTQMTRKVSRFAQTGRSICCQCDFHQARPAMSSRLGSPTSDSDRYISSASPPDRSFPRQTQRFAHVADGTTGTKGDKGTGHGGMVVSIALIDVLNDFFAAGSIEVNIDVRDTWRSSERKRSKTRSWQAGQSVRCRADKRPANSPLPRPWQRMPWRANRTMSQTIRK